MPKKGKELTNRSKVICDCFEFLHQAEMGKATLENLSHILGLKGNKAESNYRQVERVKQRCIRAGIPVVFDDIHMKFRVPRNSKLDFLEKAIPRLEELRNRKHAFGFYAEKVSTVASTSLIESD